MPLGGIISRQQSRVASMVSYRVWPGSSCAPVAQESLAPHSRHLGQRAGSIGCALVALHPESVVHVVWCRPVALSVIVACIGGGRDHANDSRGGPRWVAVLPGDGVHRVLLAWALHLPPSAASLVSDYRFRRSAQRLARLTWFVITNARPLAAR
jgi:hypothetical protein